MIPSPSFPVSGWSKRKLFLVLLAVACTVALLGSLIANTTVLHSSRHNPVRIAVLGPLEGPDGAIGRQMVAGAQVYAETLNAGGGLDGHPLEIVAIDENAADAPQQAVRAGAVAVLGHWSPDSAARGAPVYKAAGLPFLSLAAGAQDAWNLLPDQTQEIRFLANYVRNIVGEKTISIVHAAGERPEGLSQTFDLALQRFGTKVVFKWAFESASAHLDQDLAAIAADMDDKKLSGAVLVLAEDSRAAAKVVTALRAKGLRNPLIGSGLLATQAFREHFESEWKAVGEPGGSARAALNGTLLTTPLLFDTSGETTQSFRSSFISRQGYGPDWVGAQAFDAMRMLVLGMAPPPGGQLPTPAEQAAQLICRLEGMNRAETAFPAMTGALFFNAQHQSGNLPLVGIYNGMDLISAMTQLSPIRDEGVVDYLKEIMAGRALYVNDRFMYKTNVVYAGVRVEKVSEFDPKGNTAQIEAMLWFRWRGSAEPQDIVFTNAVSPVKLGEPERQGQDGDLNYRAYRVKGRFFLNYSSAPRSYGTHLVGMSFHHRLLGRNNLMYVNDVLGMGLVGQNRFVDQVNRDAIAATPSGALKQAGAVDKLFASLTGGGGGGDPLTEYLNNSRILASLSTWVIDRAWVSQEIAVRGADGDPVFVGFGRPRPAFSLVDMGMVLRPDTVAARDVIPRDWFVHIAIFALVGSILAAMLDRKERGQFWRMQTMGLRLICWPVLLVASGNLALDYALKNLSVSTTDMVVMGFDILWWLVPARLFAISVERFLWVPLENRSGRRVPGVIRNFTAASVYLFALFGVVAFVMDKPITSLLATGGLTAMIIGLAVQANIANVFSGIILNIERPFAVGDWIKIDRVVGRVMDITWRTTKLLSSDGTEVFIPNRKVSESNVENLSKARALDSSADIFVDWRHSPDEVLSLIRECLPGNKHMAVDGPDDEPTASFAGIVCQNGHWVARYKVGFLVRMLPKRGKAMQELWLRLWPRLRRQGIGWPDFAVPTDVTEQQPQETASA